MSRIFGLAAGLALAVAATAAARADEEAVRKTVAAYVEAFNEKQLDTLAAMWVENGSHLDRETGERTEGRDRIRTDIAAVLKDRPDARLAGHIERVRFIRPDVASVEGQTGVAADGETPELSAFTAILVHVNGKWLIDSVEESPIPAPATAHDALRDLEWLVGRWVDDAEDARVETTVRWTNGGSFLLRSFVIRTADGDARQGTQVIGWDPRSSHIRSWTFDADGSFGDAVWSRSGEDWLIKSSQTLADGKAASGTFVMKRVDDDKLTLQLIGHEIEGEPQPTRPAATVVRATEDESQPAIRPSGNRPEAKE